MIVCRQCGQRSDGGEFCAACGAFLEWEGERVEASETDDRPEPVRVREPAPAPRPEFETDEIPEPDEPDVPAPDVTSAGRVRCLECGAYNPTESRFCRRCGATLDLILLAGPSPAGPAETAVATAATPADLPIPDQPPPPERALGLQPAMAKERPAPVRPTPTEPAVAPGGPTCPQCGTANDIGRRFCRRCGAGLVTAAPTSAPLPAPALSWWRRLMIRLRRVLPGGADGERSRQARSAYQRSLDLRFRVLRWVTVAGGLGVGAGLLGVAGFSPISGAQDLWRRVFPRNEPITEVTAATDPVDVDRREFAATAAVDGAPDTAWAAGWRLGPDDPAAEACAVPPGTGGADAALELTLAEPTDLSKLQIQAGLPEGDPDRASQWRPTLLEVRYDDGSCQQVELDDRPGAQEHTIKAEDTISVRIAVLDAAMPASGTGDLVSIGEVRLYRPA